MITHWAWWWRGRRGTLIAELQLAGEAHGDSEGLRVVDLDFEAKWRLEAPGEELDALFLIEAPGTGEDRLKTVLVLLDSAGALARGQFVEGIGAQRWSVAEMEKILEAAP